MGVMEGAWSLSVDLFESIVNVMVKVDLPGMKKEDINVSVHGDIITIKGEKKTEKESGEEGRVKTERFYGTFNRVMTLPAEVDETKVKASYRDGVLEIILAKKEEQKPKQIKVDIE